MIDMSDKPATRKTILPPKEKEKKRRIISQIEYDKWLDEQQMDREDD